MKAQIKELGDIITGNTPSKQEQGFWDSADICFVKPDMIGECGIEQITDSKEYISEKSRRKARIVNSNAILVTCIGTIGKVGIVRKECAFNQQINAIVPNQRVAPKYLAYCLLYNRGRLAEIANAPVVPIINKTQFGEFVVDIEDNKAKQMEIVETLDLVSFVIESRKQEIRKLDELIKARFVEMFVGKNYPLVSVDDLSLGKGEYGAQSASIDYDASRPRYVRITDINDDGTLNDDLVSSSNVGDDQQYKLSYGDFLFARMGATVGKTYAYKNGNLIYAGYLIRYKLNLDKVMPEYLYAYTRLEEYWNWVKLNQSGAAQPGINAKKYGSLQIPVPPLSEQKAFQSFVVQVDKSKAAVQQALDKAKLLFDSLMQKYFG